MIDITFDGQKKKVKVGTVGNIKEQLKITQKDQISCIAQGKFLTDDDRIQKYQEPYVFQSANFAVQQLGRIDQIMEQFSEKANTCEILKTKCYQLEQERRTLDQEKSQLMNQMSATILSSSNKNDRPQFEQNNAPKLNDDNQQMEIEILNQKEQIEQLNEQINNFKKEVFNQKQQYKDKHFEFIAYKQKVELENIGNNKDSNIIKKKEEQINELQQQINSQTKQLLENKDEIYKLKAQNYNIPSSPNQNHLIEQYRNEGNTLRQQISELNSSNNKLERDLQKVKQELWEERDLNSQNMNQTTNITEKQLLNQLEIQKKENGNLRQKIGQYMKNQLEFEKEQMVNGQSLSNLELLSHNKQNKITQLEFKLKGVQEDLEYYKVDYNTLFTKMKDQEQTFQQTVEQIKQKSAEIIDLVNQDKEENGNLINQLDEIIQGTQTSIKKLEIQLANQLSKGQDKEAELTKEQMTKKENKKKKLKDLNVKQCAQLKIKDENLQKIAKLRDIEIIQTAVDQHKIFLKEQEERKRIRDEQELEIMRIQDEQNRIKQNNLDNIKYQKQADQWRNKQNKNIQALKLAQMSKQSHGIIEVCFLVDSTGSMEKHINQARQCVNGTIEQIKKLTNRDCKWACVAYQDFKELRELKGKYRQIDFTTNPSELQNFMNTSNLKCHGGGDFAEDVKGGMEQAFKLSWKMPFKIIILITDAPSHGRKYHQGCVDDHPDVVLDETLIKFKQTNTFLIGLQLNKFTGHMFQEFSDFFKSNEAEEFFMTEDLTQTQTEQIWTNIVKLISTAAENATQTNQSGTKTKNRKLNANAGKGGAMEALCKNLSDPINFDKQPGIQLTENTFEIYNVSLRKENFEQKLDKVWEIDVDKDFLEQKEINKWDCIRTTKRFAEGQMKAVYLMKRKSLEKEVYVIKQPLGGMTYTTLRDAKMECRSHMISKAFLSAFIDELTLAKQEKGSPLFIPNVEYSNFLILQDKPNSFWIAERFYEGEFVKYNNNYGWISEENNDQNQLAQAYSYYTYFSSNFTAVVNDIQGVGQFWTDPALNTTNEHLDQTDMGKDGIAMFLVTYQQKSNCGKKYLDLLGIKI